MEYLYQAQLFFYGQVAMACYGFDSAGWAGEALADVSSGIGKMIAVFGPDPVTPGQKRQAGQMEAYEAPIVKTVTVLQVTW